MDKAILVLPNNPKKCAVCQLRCSYENHLFCFMTSKDLSNDEYYNKKPDWCPLKSIPEEDNSWTGDEYYDGWRMGYNACLKKILDS
jgi:hypothetical protein